MLNLPLLPLPANDNLPDGAILWSAWDDALPGTDITVETEIRVEKPENNERSEDAGSEEGKYWRRYYCEDTDNHDGH